MRNDYFTDPRLAGLDPGVTPNELAEMEQIEATLNQANPAGAPGWEQRQRELWEIADQQRYSNWPLSPNRFDLGFLIGLVPLWLFVGVVEYHTHGLFHATAWVLAEAGLYFGIGLGVKYAIRWWNRRKLTGHDPQMMVLSALEARLGELRHRYVTSPRFERHMQLAVKELGLDGDS